MARPSLFSLSRAHLGDDYLERGSISDFARRYQQVKRFNGGDWGGKFDIVHSDPGYLQHWVDNRILTQVVAERGGIPVGRFIVAEIRSSINGVQGMVSIDALHNAIRSEYQDEEGDIRAWPPILQGTCDTGTTALTLTDTSKQFDWELPSSDAASSLVGGMVVNVSTGATGRILDYTTDTVTVESLTGGKDRGGGAPGGQRNEFRIGDLYEIWYWFRDDASITEYGRWELILSDPSLTEENAESKVRQHITWSAEPQFSRLGYKFNAPNRLTITLDGFASLANAWYLTTGANSDVGTYVQSILALDTDPRIFSGPHAIDGNTEDASTITEPMRVYQAWEHLALLGSQSNPYRITVGRQVEYTQLDVTPAYQWTSEGFKNMADNVPDPFTIEPLVIRDATVESKPPPPGSLLEDGRDDWLELVTADEVNPFPKPKIEGDFTQDIDEAVERNLGFLEASASETSE